MNEIVLAVRTVHLYAFKLWLWAAVSKRKNVFEVSVLSSDVFCVCMARVKVEKQAVKVHGFEKHSASWNVNFMMSCCRAFWSTLSNSKVFKNWTKRVGKCTAGTENDWNLLSFPFLECTDKKIFSWSAKLIFTSLMPVLNTGFLSMVDIQNVIY